jgi:ribosomal protein S14
MFFSTSKLRVLWEQKEKAASATYPAQGENKQARKAPWGSYFVCLVRPCSRTMKTRAYIIVISFRTLGLCRVRRRMEYTDL